MIEESIQGSASDVPDRNTGLMQPDEDMPARAPVGVQPDRAIILRRTSLEKGIEMIEVVLEFTWMSDTSLVFQEPDKPQRSGHEAARIRLKHPSPLSLHPRAAAIMAAEPAQHTMVNFANRVTMPIKPEQEVPCFAPKMAYLAVRQAVGPQVLDESTKTIFGRRVARTQSLRTCFCE